MMNAACRAGEIVRAGYGQEQDIRDKGWGDLVSQIDKDCDLAILEELEKARPGQPILSEEINPNTDVSRGQGWVVDPLDGTSAMLYRTSPDMPAVMLAKLEDGVGKYSVVHFPLTNEMFYAARGLGAYKGKERLSCTDEKLAKAWVEMNQFSDSRHESKIFRRLRDNLRGPGGAKLVSSSPPHSGVGVRIAEGSKKLSAVIHDNSAKKVKQGVWDVMPPALILEEAGGVIVNFKNKPYNPFKPEPFIMAASAALAKEIIRRSKRRLLPSSPRS
jgi:myo-inositol-1(or 4)-monophosphatase